MDFTTKIYTNGSIITMDPENPKAEAVVIRDGIIQFVGNNTEAERIAHMENSEVIDLHNLCVIPGLHDCHVHAMETGMASTGAQLSSCTCIDEVLELLKLEARHSDNGWVRGNNLDESALRENRPPTLAELSDLFPDRGVFISDRGLHYSVVNKRAMEQCSINGTEAGVMYGADGLPNGRMQHEANRLVRNYYSKHVSDEQRTQAIRKVEATALENGITTIHAMEGEMFSSDLDIPVFLRMQDSTNVDFLVYWNTLHFEYVESMKLKRIGTDILADGSIGSRTAAFDEPYSDAPGTSGELYFSDDMLTDFITSALRKNIQCGFHAIGSRGIRQVLDCYEKAYRRCPAVDPRFRIEHFGFCSSEDIDRAAKNRIVVSTQPAFSFLRGGEGSIYQLRVGAKRERTAYPLKELLDGGVVLSGGSDSTVTPMNSILGIHSAVNHPYSEHRISVYQALKMFTLDAAYAAYEDVKKGSLKKGKIGDMTVLSDNIFSVPENRIRDIKVEMTIKSGKIVYKRGERSIG